MRHLKRGRKLNRTPMHRRAMIRNMVTSLFIHGRITTTPAKAKEARPFAEKLITLAKKNTLHAHRRAVQLLQDKSVVSSLFSEIGPRYRDRPGGYTRILHLSKTRVGDSAPQCIFELVEEEIGSRKAQAPAVAAVEPAKTEEASGLATDATDAPAPAGEEAATEAKAEAADPAATADDAAEKSET